MKPRHLSLLLPVLLIGLIYQQYSVFRTQRNELVQLGHDSSRLAYLIDKALYEEEALRKRQETTRDELEKLRLQLPASISLPEEEQRISEAATRRGVKILAMKSALYSKPFYREAVIGLTVEGTNKDVARFTSDLTKTPRIIHVTSTAVTGKKSAVLSVTLFSVDATDQTVPPLAQCKEAEGGVWLPPLLGEINRLYAAYREKCQFITQYGEIYQRQLQLRKEQEEIAHLRAIAAQLAPTK